MTAISQMCKQNADLQYYSQKSTVKQEDPVWAFL